MIAILLALGILSSLAGCATQAAPQVSNKAGSGKNLVFENGMAQPILTYTDLRDTDYTNEGSDILRYCVYIETDHDTDSDGKADLVEALVQVPRAAAEGNFKAATIYDPTPYGAGTVEESSMDSSPFKNPVPFDYDKLYEPGEKRTPKGSMTTLEAAKEADPESWNYIVPYSGASGYSYAQLYDPYLVRGFAVVEAGGIGTYGSEGFELCGFDLERDSHKCVVEWLAGDRVAYTDPYHDIEIKAEWSNGNIAMTGCSYGGTLPFEVATTGVKGLKTIIPFAGIASWYDYTNSQGAPLYLSASYADALASYNSGAAFLDDSWTVIDDDYASFLWQISEDQEATNGDYAKIWADRDYSLDPSKINCSALIVHGLNDFNVTTKQSDLMARAFARAGQPYKLVLHQDGHNFLNGIVVNGELWQGIMNKWLSHYLYDVDNGIEDMPAVSVQSNVDGSFKTYDTWGDFAYDTFEYDKTVNPDDVSHIDTTAIASYSARYDESTDDFGRMLLRDDYYLSLPESTKATYSFELPDNYTMYGVPEVHIRMSTRDVKADGMVVSAMLMDTIDEETSFKAYLTKERLYNVLPKKTIGVVETGGGLPRTKVQEFVKSNATAKLITFGHTDLKNYGGGYEGKDYTKHEEDMKAGEYYDYTIYLQPTSYTFEPGHKAVLVITGWDPYRAFLDEDYMNGVVTDSVDSRYTYSFNIDNASFEFRFPREKGSAPSAAPSKGSEGSDPQPSDVTEEEAESAALNEELFMNAVHDAVFIEDDEVLPLVNIKKDDEDVLWDGDRVLVAFMHKYPESYPAGEDIELKWGNVWCVSANEMVRWIQENSAEVSDWTLRLHQLLGMPTTKEYTTISTIWVDADLLYRPANVTDKTAEMAATYQETGEEAFDTMYKEWFNSNIIWSYFDSAVPWTRLGYTYDWADNDTEYGLSEFLIFSGADATVEGTYSIEDFVAFAEAFGK